MTETEFDQCVTGFFQAASGELGWGEALLPMHRHFGNWVTQMLALDLVSGTVEFSFEVGDATPEVFLDFVREWHSRDPRTQHALMLAEGEWMNCAKVFDDAFVANDLFYQQFLIPYGGRWVSGTKLIHDGNFVAILALLRGREQCPYDSGEGALAQRLARHLAQALRLYRAHVMLAGQASSGLTLLGRLRTPLLLIDEQRQIHYANPAAREVFDAGGALFERNGYLNCRTQVEDMQLLLALRRLQLWPNLLGDREQPWERTFVRCAVPGSTLHLSLFLQAVRPETSLGAFGRVPLAMVLMHDPRRRLELDPFIVGAAFGLTPAESQLAVGMARGLSVADVAQERRVSVETVRSQLKSVFAKTGASQQSDLVSLLATLPA